MCSLQWGSGFQRNHSEEKKDNIPHLNSLYLYLMRLSVLSKNSSFLSNGVFSIQFVKKSKQIDIEPAYLEKAAGIVF